MNWSRILILILIFPFLTGNWSCAANKNIGEKEIVHDNNKIIPENILEEATIALSHYPELEDVEIEFRYKNKMKKALMQAQPKMGNLFKGKKDHSYYVFISSKFLLENKEFSIDNIPSEVLIGWLGHELGHIMDYRERSSLELAKFGVRYITSDNFIRKAERTADTYAINHGMGNYVFATKDFILNHSNLSDKYKKRKVRLYLSPEEILALVDNLEEELEEIEEEES
ncbi:MULTISPECIES: hypothetical protein [Antarcticibacterium]|uniref:hypothetical protein n=1 Tax=Antarcticibacterium TaxID=2058174 RepID=UPI001FE2B97C|nr:MULTISPECIES: hypothetical protein [Antarcticibacterium]